MAFFQHENLVGGKGRAGQNSFGHGGEEATKFQGQGVKNRFFSGEPKPGEHGEDDIGGLFDPSGGKAHSAGDGEGEVAKISFGSTKVEGLADGAGLSERAHDCAGDIGDGEGAKDGVDSAREGKKTATQPRKWGAHPGSEE